MRHARNALGSLREPQLRQVRWFEVLTHAVDSYMRSPLFLICLRCGLEASNRAQAIGRGGFMGRGRGWRRNLPTSPQQ